MIERKNERVGTHPNGQPIHLLSGPYGLYLQCDLQEEAGPEPHRVALPSWVKRSRLTSELAEGLIQFPRSLGTFEDTPVEIRLHKKNGFYVHHRGLNYSSCDLGKSISSALQLDLSTAVRAIVAERAYKKIEPHQILQAEQNTSQVYLKVPFSRENYSASQERAKSLGKTLTNYILQLILADLETAKGKL